MQFHYPDTVYAEDLEDESKEQVEKKIDALLEAMTQEEKMNLCHGGVNPPETGNIANGGYLPGVPRLGVPEIRMFDGPAGVTSVHETTGLPTELILSCAWDPDLAEQYGHVEGSENAAISGNAQLGAQFDLVRSPQFVRNKDMMGEDPFLTASLAEAQTKGIQREHVMAVAKHFFAASSSASPVSTPDQIVDMQTLHELYFPPFESAARKGNASAFMSCYGKINGSFASENEYAEKTVLRDMWNYKGLIMSDWGANRSLSIGKGLDMEMPVGFYNSNDRLRLGLSKGRITQDDIDLAVRHILYGLGICGYLSLVQLDENGKVLEEPGRQLPIRIPDTYTKAVKSGLLEKNAVISRRTAVEGMVLLKNNDRALPIETDTGFGREESSKECTVALIGLGAEYLVSGQGQERSYGTLYRMKSPASQMRRLAGAATKIRACVGVDLPGRAVPSENLYQDEEGKKHGVLRTFGIRREADLQPDLLPDLGGAGFELKGMAASENEEDQDVVPFVPDMHTDMAADVPGQETGKTAFVDSCIDFTCGITDDVPDQAYRNGRNGTAMAQGSAYTFEGYLKAPETGTYDLMMEIIGGTGRFHFAPDGTHLKYAAGSDTREGTQWPWGSLICTPEGMEIRGVKEELTAGKTYHFRFLVRADAAGKDLQFRFAWITPSMRRSSREEALAAAGTADKVVFFLCDDYTLPHIGEAQPSDLGSYKSVEPSKDQMQLLSEIKTSMKPEAKLICVVQSSQILELGEVDSLCDAILFAGMIGQEGGTAIAELLLGKSNPSGKLTFSIPRKSSDTLLTDEPGHMQKRGTGIPDENGRPRIYYDEGIFTGYRWFEKQKIAPLYAFGHGLSYTQYRYDHLEVHESSDGSCSVTFDVTNIGDRRGTEIAQVYLGKADVPENIQMAEKQLCGYMRIRDIQPGDTRHITIQIPERSFCYWDPEAEWKVRPDGTKDRWVHTKGIRKVLIGGASDRIYLSGAVGG